MDIENIDTKVWAQQIREIKIRELKNLVKYEEKKLKKNAGLTFPATRTLGRARISKLKEKLKILQTQ